MPAEDYLPEWQATWDASRHDPEIFFASLLTAGKIDRELYDHELGLLAGPPAAAEVTTEEIAEEVAKAYVRYAEEKELPVAEPLELYRRQIGDALFERQKGYFATAFREVLVSLWRWVLEQLRELLDLIVGFIKPKLQEAWEFAKAKFEDYGRQLYDGTFRVFEGHSPIRPEDAPALAVKLYLFAMGMGMAAHGTAALTELVHPLKTIGLHQTAAALGDFAGFGRIAGATIGPLVNRVLGQTMTYAVQNRYRPMIPRENLLIEFRAKREIDKAEFDRAMAYQGFSQEWIDIIERWQWKDPRMFEIIRLADVGLDQGTPPSEEMPWLRRFGITGDKLRDWWLYRKFMRAGYEDCDLDVMVRFIHRREVAFALTYVRTAIRRNYRWGYLSDDELKQWMERLSLPEQARQWIFWAGELDREYFYRQDLQSYYVTAYRNDVIGNDELLISLVSMGLPAREAEMITRIEKVKKQPKPTVAVAAAVKPAMTELQTKYIQLYREQYRKDLITQEQYLMSLEAIGLETDLARVAVAIEAAKKGLAVPA